MKYSVLLLLLIASAFSFSQSARSKVYSGGLPAGDQMPEYPGGNDAMVQFLKDNFQYPDLERQNNIQGLVVLNLVIETDGRIINVSIRRSLDDAIDEEVKRVVKLMPNFRPGIQRGESVRMDVTLAVMVGPNGINVSTNDLPSDALSIYKKSLFIHS
jgi:TonB family protein